MELRCLYYFRKGNLSSDGPVDLVLSCVDNFEARMAINTVRVGVWFAFYANRDFSPTIKIQLY